MTMTYSYLIIMIFHSTRVRTHHLLKVCQIISDCSEGTRSYIHSSSVHTIWWSAIKLASEINLASSHQLLRKSPISIKRISSLLWWRVLKTSFLLCGMSFLLLFCPWPEEKGFLTSEDFMLLDRNFRFALSLTHRFIYCHYWCIKDI